MCEKLGAKCLCSDAKTVHHRLTILTKIILKNDSDKKEAELKLIITNSVKRILNISIYKLYVISKKIRSIYFIKIRVTYRKLFRFYNNLKKLYNPPLLDNNIHTAIVLDN